MIITIVQSEIEKAIEDYVASKIRINGNQQFQVELSATRGSQGITANITIKNDCYDTVPMVAKECSHEEATFTASSEEETQTQTQTQAQDTTQDTTQESSSIFTQPEKKKNPFADL